MSHIEVAIFIVWSSSRCCWPSVDAPCDEQGRHAFDHHCAGARSRAVRQLLPPLFQQLKRLEGPQQPEGEPKQCCRGATGLILHDGGRCQCGSGCCCVGLVCDHHLRSDHGDRRASRAGAMMQGGTREGLRAGADGADGQSLSGLYLTQPCRGLRGGVQSAGLSSMRRRLSASAT